MNAADYLSIVRPAVAVGPNPQFNWMMVIQPVPAHSSSIYSTRYLNDGESTGWLSVHAGSVGSYKDADFSG